MKSISTVQKTLLDLKSSGQINLWVFIGFALFFLFIFAPMVNTPFGLIDDHEIYRFASPAQLSPQAGPPISLGEMIGTLDAENGRVRTVFYTIRFALIYLLGTQSTLWHTTFLLIGLVTACLFYASQRILKIEILPAILGTGMVMLLPTTSYLWIRSGAPENIGALFTSLAFFAIAKSSRQTNTKLWDSLLILSALAAALTKESFILTIPALAYARLLVSPGALRKPLYQTIAANLRILALLGLAFISTLGLLIWRVQIAGLASQGGSSFNLNTAFLSRFLDLVGNSVWQAAGYAPLIVTGLVMLIKPSQMAHRIRVIGLLSLFPGLIVVPQLILYATRDTFDLRYWFPAIIGIVFINTLSLMWLARHSHRLIYLGSVVWLSLWLIAFTRQTAFQISWFRADAVSLNHMLDAVTQRVNYQRAVVIAGDPGIHYEMIISLVYHIAQRGRADIPIYVLLAPSESANRALTETQTRALLNNYFAGHNALTDIAPTQVDAVILLNDAKTLPAFWLGTLPLSQLAEYSEPVPTFSFKEGKFTSTSVGYKVLWFSPSK